MKIAAFLMLAAAFVLVAANSEFHFSFSQGTEAATPSPYGPAVDEVTAVVSAGTNAAAERDGRALRRLFDRGSTASIRHHAPMIARRIERDLIVLNREVQNVDATTSVGRDCQLRTLDLLERQHRSMRRFLSELRVRETTGAVRRARSESDRLQRWYGRQLELCVAGAPPRDRAALRAALFG
jgi:hypothetical protein